MENKLTIELNIKPIADQFDHLEKMIAELKVILSNERIEKPEIITRKEFLEQFHKSEGWLWTRMKDGDIPYIKMGRKIHFDKAEVLKYFTMKTKR